MQEILLILIIYKFKLFFRIYTQRQTKKVKSRWQSCVEVRVFLTKKCISLISASKGGLPPKGDLPLKGDLTREGDLTPGGVPPGGSVHPPGTTDT